MTNKLLKLEEEVGLITRPRAAVPATHGRATRAPRSPDGRSAPAPRALGALDYAIPGTVTALIQASSETCWAAVATMMLSWRRQQSLQIRPTMEGVGRRYVEKLDRNEGLAPGEHATFLAAAGLVHQPPFNPVAADLDRLLRTYGPLWLTTGHEAGADRWAHARVVVGIRGDGTDRGTELDLIDPADGQRRWVSLGSLRTDFERFVGGNVRRWVEIIHFPKDAPQSVARSLSQDVETVPEPTGDSASPDFILATALVPVRALDGGASAVAIAGLGLAVFNTGDRLVRSGKFAFDSRAANYIHRSAPASARWRRSSAEFSIRAWNPRPLPEFMGTGWQDFWFRIAFDHNGYDIRSARVVPLPDRSSEMISSEFSISFEPLPHSPESAPVAEIAFQVGGRWDPWGRGDVQITGGALLVRATGEMQLSVQSERDWVRKGEFREATTSAAPGAGTTSIHATNVHFAAGSDTLDSAGLRHLHSWYNGLPADLRSRIGAGAAPVDLVGYASRTGSDASNQRLARSRAEAVARVLRDFAGSSAAINIAAQGELAARTADGVEAANERRVEITVTT